MTSSTPGNAITFGVLALLAVAFAGYDLIEATSKGLGLIAGLGGGIISITIDEARRVYRWNQLWVRLASMALSPLGLFILFPFSLQLGIGYFIGSGISFCTGSAIQHLQKCNGPT